MQGIMTRFLATASLSIAASLCVAASVAQAADAFGIEDDALRPVPAAAASALRAHVASTDYKDCAAGDFAGMSVNLAGRGRGDDWIAKTADGCAWGTATAKIWIVRKERGAYRLVLDYGGQGVVLRKATTNGLRDLTVFSGTAGHYAEAVFKFDGRSYQQFKSCAIDLQDPNERQRHPDGRCHVD